MTRLTSSVSLSGRLASSRVPFEGLRSSSFPPRRHRRCGCLSWSWSRFRVLYAARYRLPSGSPIPPRRHRFRFALAVFHRPPSPITFAMGSSSRALSPPSESYESQPAGRSRLPGSVRHLPWGSVPHRDVSRWSPHPRASQARFVPPSAFRTPSTASSSTHLAGLFHPAATSGVRSSRGSPHKQPYELVARRCPLVVCTRPLPWLPTAPGTCARLQGFALPASPLRNMGV